MRIPNELQPGAANADSLAERLRDRHPSGDPQRPTPVEAMNDVRAQRQQIPSRSVGDGIASAARQRRSVAGVATSDRRRGERRQQSLPILLETRSTRSRRQEPEYSGIDTEV